MYWQKDIETKDPKEIKEYQLFMLNKTLRQAANSKVYGEN